MRLTDESFRAVTRRRYLGGPRPLLQARTANGRIVPVRHVSIAELGALEYHRIVGYWAQLDAWFAWLDAGKRGVRPKVWRIVPRFAWQLRSEILKARKPWPVSPAVPSTAGAPGAPYVNLVFAAQNPLAALAAPAKYRILFTADPAYDSWATAGAANAAREAGHLVGVWYVPTQVSGPRARQVAARLGTDFIVGQAETIDEFWASVHDGCPAVIGNLSAIVPHSDAVSYITSRKIAFVNEFYWNQDRERQPDNHNLPVSSICVAFYDGHSDSSSPNAWQPHAGVYQSAGYWWPTMSVYGPGATADDFRSLP